MSHAVSTVASTDQVPQHLLRCPGDPIQPVVEHQHHLAVIGQFLVPWLDDECTHQPPIELQADVGMVEIGSGHRHRELVEKALSRRNRWLRDVRHPVHRIGDRDTVQVDRRRLREPVLQQDAQRLALPHTQLWTRNLTSIGARAHPPTSEFDFRLHRLDGVLPNRTGC
jgi:hypothetical protein